jgi:uncharacterized surface protein with fasciclin (FAS1) repeats
MKKLLMTTAIIASIGAPIAAQAGNYGKAGEKSYSEKMMKKDIVETAMAKDDFSTLVTAVKQAELVAALQGEGPFTVFAPTNDAFAKVPESTLNDLLKPENKSQLQDVLKYHVVSGKIKAKDIKMGSTTLETLEGDEILIVKTEDGVTIDGANVVMADVKTSNGVIHAIDAVVMPN